MSEHSLESLASRLSKVERQNRRLKVIGGVALLLVGSILGAFMLLFGGILKGWPVVLPNIHAKYIYAQSYVVRGKNDKHCGFLSGDGPSLHLGDFLSFRQTKREGYFILSAGKKSNSAKVHPSIHMSVTDNGEVTLALDGRPLGSIMLTLGPGDSKVKTPLIMIMKKKKLLWSAP